MALELFHPLVARWFGERFGEPTEPQALGWPEIAAGHATLIAAPTGSGKTLAAFLSCIDRILRQAIDGDLPDATQVVYVSPLKALSNDVRRNLLGPLDEIRALAAAEGIEPLPIRCAVRTGDTPAAQRQAMLRRPPHILVTTPESLYLLLTGAKSRERLRQASTVIVDEIHALARDKRGSHLALSLERLEALADRPPVRIGLSATQRPLDEIARFLVGSRPASAGTVECRVIDSGHLREIDLGIEVPPSELSAVCSNEQWAEVYQRLVQLVTSHRSTLIFVNTRRLAERVAHSLSQLLGDDAVTSHHGSLSRKLRLSAEERLKAGALKAIVATASLELGIDVGFIDLVCQIGSPRSIATLLQRIGRSGHSLGATPKGRIFPLTRDNLIEALALVRAVRQGRLDAIEIPAAPLDILAQQIVAAVACEPWREDELFELVRGAWPYRNLSREAFDDVIRVVSEGIVPGRRHGAWLHRDVVNGRLRARRGARLAAVTSGGAIPETADYRVVTDDQQLVVGTVNEDFAIESMAGDVFLLGNTSWRIRAVRGGDVIVRDARGAPATIPFWLGEGPGRTVELSSEVSQLRLEVAQRLAGPADDPAHCEASANWLQSELHVEPWVAAQAANYVAAQQVAIGLIPNERQIVFERFFDESGGMQLVIHSPFGARINRAWGLAMRKRFCRSFNFELQASADDNGIVLSLGPQHSFPLEQMFQMLQPQNAEHLLVQALLAAPMFLVRWRWNVTRALGVLRHQGGRKVPPPLQRFRADDLLSAVFPETTGCLENHVGDLEVPDHPLVRQTVYDCLHEATDVDRWLEVLARRAAGRIEFVARDTREPSPFCYELLNANPYAFLDDAPLEERRARAVAVRRSLAPREMADLGRLDPEAIARASRDAWPLVRDADELDDALSWMGLLPAAEGASCGWQPLFDALRDERRATLAKRAEGPAWWVAAGRWRLALALDPGLEPEPPLALPPALDVAVEAHQALVAVVRGRLEAVGPVTASQMAADLGLRRSAVEAALDALEGEGFAMRGRFTLDAAGGINGEIQWCERRLLARIHRQTLEAARAQVQPVSPEVFLRYLCRHQHLTGESRRVGQRGLLAVLEQLQGFEAPAGAWEADLLAGRLEDYQPAWLDDLIGSGQVVWGRFDPPRRDGQPATSAGMTRAVPIALAARRDLGWLMGREQADGSIPARTAAQSVFQALSAHGALFVDDLVAATGLLPAQIDEALGELAALGLATADGFAPLRPLVGDPLRGAAAARRRHRPAKRQSRWSTFPPLALVPAPADRAQRWARLLLARYGVIFRDLLTRESLAPGWGELVPVLRRMEARGEIRGGRFVAQVAPEQYALGQAVSDLRRLREKAPDGEVTVVSAADPLNLLGIVGSGPRVAAVRASAIALRDGRPLATLQGGDVSFCVPVEAALAAELTRSMKQTALVRRRVTETPSTWLRLDRPESPRPRPTTSSLAGD